MKRFVGFVHAGRVPVRLARVCAKEGSVRVKLRLPRMPETHSRAGVLAGLCDGVAESAGFRLKDLGG